MKINEEKTDVQNIVYFDAVVRMIGETQRTSSRLSKAKMTYGRLRKVWGTVNNNVNAKREQFNALVRLVLFVSGQIMDDIKIRRKKTSRRTPI